MYKRHKTGRQGEDLACKYLEKNNYKILTRNFRCKQGEIDIIAYDTENNEIVFIEVKTRNNQKFGSPIDAVDKTKIKHMLNTIKYYIYINKLDKYFIRIDAIEIYSNFNYINHIKQII